MSSRTTRHSGRTVRTIRNRYCRECHKIMLSYAPQDDRQQHQCPECFRLNDSDYIWRTYGQDIRHGHFPFCLCACRCVDTDDTNDADFEMSSDVEEPEDDEATRLDTRTEAIMMSRYGWQTNVTLNENTERERSIFWEGPGHFAAATAHDPAISAESSMANGSNRIGVTEIHDLTEALQPWEAGNMVAGDPTRTWQDFEAIFPEMRDMHRNEPRPESPPPRPLICRFCTKPKSGRWRRWFVSGRMLLCATCGLTQRPSGSQEEDPDLPRFNGGAPADRDVCHCRCVCQNSSGSSNEDSVMGEAPLGPVTPTRRPMTLPGLPFVGYEVFIRDNDDYDVFRRNIAEEFGLRDIRISRLPDLDMAMHENMQWAYEDCLSAIQFSQWGLAVRYIQMGLQIGRYMLNLNHLDPLMHNLLEADEGLIQYGADRWDNSVFRTSVESLTEPWSPSPAPAAGNGLEGGFGAPPPRAPRPGYAELARGPAGDGFGGEWSMNEGGQENE